MAATPGRRTVNGRSVPEPKTQAKLPKPTGALKPGALRRLSRRRQSLAGGRMAACEAPERTQRSLAAAAPTRRSVGSSNREMILPGSLGGSPAPRRAGPGAARQRAVTRISRRPYRPIRAGRRPRPGRARSGTHSWLGCGTAGRRCQAPSRGRGTPRPPSRPTLTSDPGHGSETTPQSVGVDLSPRDAVTTDSALGWRPLGRSSRVGDLVSAGSRVLVRYPVLWRGRSVLLVN